MVVNKTKTNHLEKQIDANNTYKAVTKPVFEIEICTYCNILTKMQQISYLYTQI